MTEREWREASDERTPKVALAMVVAVGAVLRFWALGHGIPYAVGVDEPEIMNRVVHMMTTGDYHPHFFDYPTLYFYVELVVACVRFLAGATSGQWHSLSQVVPADFYLWARAVTALLGTATVVVVYVIGIRWGARHALLAAGLMAVLPLHVRESHYVLTDVPMTFFVTVTFLLSLRAHEKGTVILFAAAGATAGLAAATKYTGALALLLPLIAVWMTLGSKPSRLRCALGVLAGFAGAFLVAAPYTVLDLPAFLDTYARLASEYRPRGGEAPWLTYLKHLRLQLQWPALILALSGVVLGGVRAIKGPGRVRWILLVTFPLLYFWFISTKGLVYARYLLPMAPFICILAAIAVVSGVSLLRRFEIPRAPRTVLIVTLTVAAVLPPLVTAIGFVRMIARPSTQAAAYRWILENVPKGSTLAIEKRDLVLPEARYRVEHVVRLTDLTLDEYAERGFQYFIASDQVFGPFIDRPQTDPARHEAYMQLFGRSTELARFEPGDGRVGPRLWLYRIGRP